jgi:putative membrane protein
MIDLWLKAFHIIFVIAWMAGLMMYPRLKIYQLNDEPGGKLFKEMKLAAQRLRNIILTPALIVTWVLGVTMLIRNPDFLQQGWLHTKLALVVIITIFHGWFISVGKKIDASNVCNLLSPRF